jgi:hypothetical protein
LPTLIGDKALANEMNIKHAAWIVVLAVVALAIGCDRLASEDAKQHDQTLHSVRPETLKAAREKCPTQLRPTDYRPSGVFLPPTVRAYLPVKFPSKVGPLAAYLSRDPGDGKKHPVVVWSNGGIGSIDPPDIMHQPAENDQSPDVFREAGFVVMVPSRRGENDNPGKFELFCGEVDDLLSAVDYARKLPYVDPARVYLIGSNTGGTLVLLAAESGAPVRLAIALGGPADITEEVAILQGGYEQFKHVPFDWQNPQEMAMRCPANYAADIRVPTWYIEGRLADLNVPSARVLGSVGEAYHVPLHVLFIDEADQFTALRSTKRLIAEKLQADTGPKPKFSLTDVELNEAFSNRQAAQPKIVDKPFATITPAAAHDIARALASLRATYSQTSFFVRVFRTPDDDAGAAVETSFDIDDVECRVADIPVVMDRRSLDTLEHVVIGLARGNRGWLTAVRVEAPK